MDNFTDKNYSKKFMGKLPEKIQQRLNLLLQYHKEFEAIENEFEDQEMELRKTYNSKFLPLFERRKEIVTGESEPTEEEVKGGFPSEHEGKVSLTEGSTSEEKGIPKFWTTVLTNHQVIVNLIQDEDLPILNCLTDITSCVIPGKRESFKVEFTFAPNDFIVEPTLTLSVVSDTNETKISRSTVTWKKKDFLYERIKPTKKKGPKGKPSKDKVPRESFFWIFEETEEGDEDLEAVVLEEEQLLNLLHTMHHKVIPGAVNFYTGEMDGASDEDDEEDEEEDEEDDEDDDM